MRQHNIWCVHVEKKFCGRKDRTKIHRSSTEYPSYHTEHQPQNVRCLCKKVNNIKHNRDISYVNAKTKVKISFV